MKVEFESVDNLLEAFDKQMQAEESECLAILDEAINNIRNVKEVEEDVESIEF